jgi:hypothetical protein
MGLPSVLMAKCATARKSRIDGIALVCSWSNVRVQPPRLLPILRDTKLHALHVSDGAFENECCFFVVFANGNAVLHRKDHCSANFQFEKLSTAVRQQRYGGESRNVRDRGNQSRNASWSTNPAPRSVISPAEQCIKVNVYLLPTVCPLDGLRPFRCKIPHCRS